MINSGNLHKGQNQQIKANSKFRKVMRYIEWIEGLLNDLDISDTEKTDLVGFLNSKRVYANLNLADTTTDAKKCVIYCDLVRGL